MEYLSEAFKELKILDEDVFDLDKEGLEDLRDFQDEAEEEVIDVYDPEAETEEELEDSYVGKVILDCSVCHTDIYKDKEDVIIDEETKLANVGEECPYCFSIDGFKVIGEVKPFVETEFETDDDVDVSVDGEKVEVEEEDESLKRKRIRESISKMHKKALVEKPVYGLEPRYDSRKSFYGKAQVDTGDKGDKNKLYSYNTLVAEIKDGKPVVYGTYSATTLRHIKDWLKQNGFRADTSKQIMADYGVKDEACSGRKPMKESSGEVFRNDNGKEYTVVERSRSGKNALLNRGGQWIIAWNCPKDSGSWEQGHYFFDEDEARKLWGKKYIKESKTPVKISRKSLKEGWRGTPVKIVSHGSWGDPDLVWNNGEHEYTFNYWDIEDAMWNDFLEYSGHDDSESNDPKVEAEFDEFVQDNYDGYLEDVIAGGYFDEGSYSWHDRYKRESLKKRIRESCSINQCQKWVDYDMKKYKRISDDTMEKIKSSGYSVVKDQYGDYEVIADRKDESCGKKKSRKMKESFESPVYSEEASIRVGNGYKDIDVSIWNDGEGYTIDIGEDSDVYIDDEPVDNGWITSRLPSISWDWYDEDLDYMKKQCKKAVRAIEDFFEKNSIEEALKESIEDITIDTGDQEISVSARDKEKKSDGEMIAPLSDKMKADIEMNSDAENGEDVDVEMDEFSEEDFDELGESYLKKVYENVKSYKTTSVKEKKNKLYLEGVIKFSSGKEKKTSFVFEAKTIDKNGHAKFLGENLQISRGHKAFKLSGTISDRKFISESLNYNYRAKNGNSSQRVYGTVRTNKK